MRRPAVGYLLLIVVLGWLVASVPRLPATTAGAEVSAEDEANAVAHANALSLAFRRAAEKAQPAVVTIVSKYNLQNNVRMRDELKRLLEDPQLREMFPDRGETPPGEEDPQEGEGQIPGFGTNVGSGVITDATGVILTNSHVVANADEVVVRMPDGSELPAKEIRTDALSDVAILRVEGLTDLPAAKLGNSDSLEIGDWVIAIGSPFELESTVSAGIISGKRRSIARIRRGQLLQTDAAINPGNSGGPLVNLDGEVVGINTAIATMNGGYQGVGFAIPVNRATWIARELLEFGRVRRAYLGIQIGELTADAARRVNVAARAGVRVVGVETKTPAADAGVKADDVIVDFAGISVRAPGDLQEAVEQTEIGSTQKITVLRKGERLTFDVVLAALPERLVPPEEEPENE